MNKFSFISDETWTNYTAIQRNMTLTCTPNASIGAKASWNALRITLTKSNSSHFLLLSESCMHKSAPTNLSYHKTGNLLMVLFFKSGC